MIALYLINHLIFSVFMTLILLEGGFALTALFAYRKYKDRLMRYITPIWEVTGTFAVFYIVNFEATFPTLLGAAGTLYAIPLLIAAALIIIRNAFLVYAQYVGDLVKEGKYLKVYAIATLVALVLVLSVLSSAMTGVGANLTTGRSTVLMYLNPFNIVVIASALLISLSFASSLFQIEKFKRVAWIPLALAILFMCVEISLSIAPVSANFSSAIPFIAVLGVLVAALAVLQYKGWKHASKLSIFIVIFAINVLGVVEYPYILGGLNITSYLNNSALTQPILLITLVGGAIVAVSLSYLIYLSYLRKSAST
jgi:cytochrome d ubiquinol oxidase subunit II